MWVMRTAEYVVFTLWPPGPLEQNVSMRRSLSLIWMSTSSASGRHGHGRRRRVDAAARFGRRHALHAVDAAFVFQLAVDAASFDRGDDFLEAADARVVARHHFEPPALPLRVLAVHPEQLRGKERRFVAARAGADFEHDVLLVVRILRNQQRLQLAEQRVAPGGQRLELFLCEFAHVGVAGRGDLFSLRDVADDGPVFAEALDERLDLGERLGVLPVLGRIGLDFGAAEQLHEGVVLTLERGELIQHIQLRAGPQPCAPNDFVNGP